MTQTKIDPIESGAARPLRDVRGFWRLLLAVIAPLPMAAKGVDYLLSPVDGDASFHDTVVAYQAHRTLVTNLRWADAAFMLLLIPAIVAVLSATRRYAPRLSTAGGFLALLGFLSGLTLLGGVDTPELLTATNHLDAETMARVHDAVGNDPIGLIASVLFLVGVVIGVGLLGAALWRSRVAPAWMGIALMLGGITHPFIPGHIGQGVGLLIAAIGFGGATFALLRQSNDEFDLPPGNTDGQPLRSRRHRPTARVPASFTLARSTGGRRRFAFLRYDRPIASRNAHGLRTDTSTGALPPQRSCGRTAAYRYHPRGFVGLMTLLTLSACATTTSQEAMTAGSSASTSPGSRTSSTISNPAAGSSHWPHSIVVLGHSGATGQSSDLTHPGADVPKNSWATGTNPQVNSVYLRILAHTGAVRGHAVNLAKDGATVQDLMSQARQALALKPLPDMFLIQTIDNDIRCDGTDPLNYAPFAAALTSTLRLITTHDPRARILLVTQPGDVANNAAVTATNRAWVIGWQGDGPCAAFDSAGNLVPAHIAGLQDITDHYFAAQAASCRQFPQCKDDGGAWQRMIVTAADFSDDGNHSSVAGMAKRAQVTWAALHAVGLLPSR